MGTEAQVKADLKPHAEKELAGEAIGHPQRDSFDSRLGLIGLRQRTPGGADVKGWRFFYHG